MATFAEPGSRQETSWRWKENSRLKSKATRAASHPFQPGKQGICRPPSTRYTLARFPDKWPGSGKTCFPMDRARFGDGESGHGAAWSSDLTWPSILAPPTISAWPFHFGKTVVSFISVVVKSRSVLRALRGMAGLVPANRDTGLGIRLRDGLIRSDSIFSLPRPSVRTTTERQQQLDSLKESREAIPRSGPRANRTLAFAELWIAHVFSRELVDGYFTPSPVAAKTVSCQGTSSQHRWYAIPCLSQKDRTVWQNASKVAR